MDLQKSSHRPEKQRSKNNISKIHILFRPLVFFTNVNKKRGFSIYF